MNAFATAFVFFSTSHIIPLMPNTPLQNACWAAITHAISESFDSSPTLTGICVGFFTAVPLTNSLFSGASMASKAISPIVNIGIAGYNAAIKKVAEKNEAVEESTTAEENTPMTQVFDPTSNLKSKQSRNLYLLELIRPYEAPPSVTYKGAFFTIPVTVVVMIAIEYIQKTLFQGAFFKNFS